MVARKKVHQGAVRVKEEKKANESNSAETSLRAHKKIGRKKGKEFKGKMKGTPEIIPGGPREDTNRSRKNPQKGEQGVNPDDHRPDKEGKQSEKKLTVKEQT